MTEKTAPPLPPIQPPRRFVMDWGTRHTITEDGEIVNVYALKDEYANNLIKLTQHAKAAEKEYTGICAKRRLIHKTTLEHDKKKAQVAILEWMVDEELLDPKSDVSKAWQKKVDAEAEAERAKNLFWSMKDAVDLDIKGRT